MLLRRHACWRRCCDMSQTEKAVLYIGPHCPYCDSMISVLASLLKEGRICALEIYNIENIESNSVKEKIKTVPWLDLGEIHLAGMQKRSELIDWLEHLRKGSAQTEYLAYQLQQGALQEALYMVQDAQTLRSLIRLLNRVELDMKLQLGISAIFEHLQGSEILTDCIEDLAKTLEQAEPNRKIDVLYYLSLSQDSAARQYVDEYRNHSNKEVAAAAIEALQDLGS